MILEAHNLHKTLRGKDIEVHAVNGISLSIGPGEIVGFLGPNGAGKTTTIKMITGLVSRDEGTVSINGRDPERDPKALQDIGTILEGNRNVYWRLTALENVTYFGALKGMKLGEAQREGKRLLRKLGLGTRLDIPVRKFSRGMQQKVALASALVHKPSLLLLDEPTLGLDSLTTVNLMEIIRDAAAAGSAILLTTHQLGVAEELAHRLAIIREGDLVVDEPLQDLLDRFSGASYSLQVDGELDDERLQKIKALGGWEEDGKLGYLGSDEGLYEMIEVLKPLPILKVEKDQANLTGIFLKLAKEGDAK